MSNWIKSGKAALVAVSSDGSFSHVLSDSNATEIELSMLIKFDENTGLMIPSDIPSENTTLEFEQSDLESPKDDEPAAEQNSESESVTTFTENPVEDVSINFSISAKKLNSIGMILSMNFDETDLKIEFKGRPRKGTGSNPISVLKDAINSAGGEIED